MFKLLSKLRSRLSRAIYLRLGRCIERKIKRQLRVMWKTERLLTSGAATEEERMFLENPSNLHEIWGSPQIQEATEELQIAMSRWITIVGETR